MKPTLLTGEALAVFLLAAAVALFVFYTRIYAKEARQAHALSPRQTWILRVLRMLSICVKCTICFTEPEAKPRRQRPWPIFPMLESASATTSTQPSGNKPEF